MNSFSQRHTKDICIDTSSLPYLSMLVTYDIRVIMTISISLMQRMMKRHNDNNRSTLGLIHPIQSTKTASY